MSWPATHFLLEAVGWRGTYLIYAVLLAAVAAPLHALALPRSRAETQPPKPGATEQPAKVLPSRGLPFVLVAAAFASYAFVPSGLSAHLLAIFARSGIDAGTVVWIGALFGPAQVGARLIEFTFGRNLHPLWVARFALGALLCAFAMLMLFGLSAPVAAAFALMFGGANGLITITRGALPLALFGAAGYGRLIGRLAGPFLLMQAAAPLVMAFVVDRASDPARARARRRLRRRRARLLYRDPQARLSKHRVDFALTGVAAIAVELGAVDQLAAGRGLFRRSLRRTAVAAIEHGRELLLDQVQGVDHLGDALAGEVLEIAGLVDRHRALLDVLGEPALVVAPERGGQRLGAVVDAFGRVQDFLRGFFHAADRGAEFAGRARHTALLAFADQGSDLAPVMRDRFLHERELALERVAGNVAPGADFAQRLELIDGLALAGRRLGRRRRPAVGEHPLDAKNFALHAHAPRNPSPNIFYPQAD